MEKNPNSNSLIVDLSAVVGKVRHGASGFLYGLGNADLPSANVLEPLKPQVAAQKPEGGLQHPDGDALDVAANYQAAGGREIQIYLQDAYASWPYEQLGLEDYLSRIEPILRQALASPYRSLFSLVPFNEPDQIWYNLGDRRQALLEDWNRVVRHIKAIDPTARIVGPNFARYDSRFYRDFLVSAGEGGCLPDVISWHELGDDFFAGWNQRYNDYRAIERDLKIAPREICINEYSRIQGDLGNPGKLIQWVVRFENSQVDGCLAYWTDAGSLNNLVTPDNYNRATGAWWLYKWYGDLSGALVRVTPAPQGVTPPAPENEGLQGLACLDAIKRQVRILFGGCSGNVDLQVTGLDTAPFEVFKEPARGASARQGAQRAVPGLSTELMIHAALWETRFTGLKACGAPPLVWEGDLPILNGQVLLPVQGMLASAAYQVILTPLTSQAESRPAQCYPAEYAELTRGAHVRYYPAAVFVSAEPGNTAAGIGFVISVEENAFYTLKLRYAAGPLESAPAGCRLRLALNGAPLSELSLAATGGWQRWKEAEVSVFLTAGINRVGLSARQGADLSPVHLAWLEVVPGSGWQAAYAAAASDNSLNGAAAVELDPAAPSGKFVAGVGDGPGNSLRFNRVSVPESGIYRMVVTFANAEFRGGHSYNSQVVDRCAEIQVNDAAAQVVYFRNTFTWENYQTRVVDIDLHAGSNTIQFSNPTPGAYAPRIAKIEIAAPLGVA